MSMQRQCMSDYTGARVQQNLLYGGNQASYKHQLDQRWSALNQIHSGLLSRARWIRPCRTIGICTVPHYGYMKGPRKDRGRSLKGTVVEVPEEDPTCTEPTSIRLQVITEHLDAIFKEHPPLQIALFSEFRARPLLNNFIVSGFGSLLLLTTVVIAAVGTVTDHQSQLQHAMAPIRPQQESSHSRSTDPFYSSWSNFSSSTSDLNSNGSTHNYQPSFSSASSFRRDGFFRPHSAQDLPPVRYRKNMKTMTGFTTTEDEFAALPIAIRRKYFSTLERLRFAESASCSSPLDDVPLPPSHRKSSIAERRGVSVPAIQPRRRLSSARRSRRGSRQYFGSVNDFSWFLTLPEKARSGTSTRDTDHPRPVGCMTGSVILDAADEAVYKARRSSRHLTSMIIPPTPSSVQTSPGTEQTYTGSSATMADAMIDSFRWMDEEEDLDLRLMLDDYHANLDGAVLPTSSSSTRPSFRRTMSISKIPFGRSATSPVESVSQRPQSMHKSHNRQKSRAMSLISPKHAVHDSVSSIDPNATHYQDPEARLKLRVYLASPQKFDEAIEFGFPSLDAVVEGGADKENSPSKIPSRNLGPKKVASSENIKSFFDDSGLLFEDDTSMLDPESPLTPMGLDNSFRSQYSTPSGSLNRPKHSKAVSDYTHLAIPKSHLMRHPDSYAQAIAGNREMTLRMTLTRPDLRADESAIYGWQNRQSHSRGTSLAMDREEVYGAVKGPFGGVDGWGPPDKENGSLKRFWTKLKSSQRKSS
ncbi:hypothetical protein F5884DRAFT_763861 [Xylogone sp. PMI_703]|nr:hypothetical protein F5884DRAFT_763861 [Xylogone sp. PMI_703]